MSKKKEATEETTVEGDGAEGEGAAKKGKKKLIFIAGGAVVVILIVVGVLLSGVLGGGEKKEDAAATEEGHGASEGGHGSSEGGHGEKGGHAAVANAPVYYELPEFLVNLNSPVAGKVSFLKMSVTLELKDAEAVAKVDASKPRILDTFNTYLRELRPSDIQGSAGIYRLRDELITRLNSTMEEGLVKDILFSEIIVQ